MLRTAVGSRSQKLSCTSSMITAIAQFVVDGQAGVGFPLHHDLPFECREESRIEVLDQMRGGEVDTF